MDSSINYIKAKTDIIPEIGLILGSGLGDIANEINGVSISYEEIPNFHSSTISGHAGKLIIGELCGKNVIAMQGRFHFYEGHSMQTVVYPVKVMKKLGIEKLIVTNAAGGINKDFTPGDLMIINDHLNLMGTNPLMGKNDDSLGPRFADMSEAYKKDFIVIAQNAAQKLGIKVQNGVYAGMTGPTYETPSEIKMLRTLGADAIGMSTVPEVITANYMGIKVLGISCITNMAAGILPQPLSHGEVIETTQKVKQDFISLIKIILKEI